MLTAMTVSCDPDPSRWFEDGSIVVVAEGLRFRVRTSLIYRIYPPSGTSLWSLSLAQVATMPTALSTGCQIVSGIEG